MKWWKEIALFFIGAFSAMIVAFKLQKPTTTNNVENNTKIKKNLAPVTASNENVVETPTKKKKRFRLFKKRKKN